MKEIQAVIFDLDGTLVDSIDDITTICNTVLEQMNKPVFTSNDYRHWIGRGLHHLLISAVDNDETQLEELWNMLYLAYKDAPVQQSKVYDGIAEVIAFLEQCKIPIAILSNKEEVLVKMIIDILLPNASFFMVRGWNDNFPAKPDPAQALYISRRLGVLPRSIAFIGDSQVDVNTAAHAGMQPIFVRWGYGDAESISETAISVNNPNELKVLLEGNIQKT